MELVIKIPEEIAKQFDYEYNVDGEISKYITDTILEAYCNGTPLPKGHGRLIDADDLLAEINQFDYYDNVKEAPTIIEADKEQEE